MAEPIMILFGILIVAIVYFVRVMYEIGRPWLAWSWVGAGAAVTFTGAFRGGGVISFLLLFLVSWGVGVGCFAFLRSKRFDFSPKQAFGGTIACSIGFVLLLMLSYKFLGYYPWYIAYVIVGLLSIGVTVGSSFLLRLCFSGLALSVADAESAEPARNQDRQMVVSMLRDGKVSGEDAAGLINALGPSVSSGDELPLTLSVIGAIVGAIMVIIGFMLPWYYVRSASLFGRGFEGYQSGQHVGYVGWIVLVAGILPALFVCMPSLDKHIRQALLRMVIASIGAAFIISMLIRSPEGVGLWVAAFGFMIQLVTAIVQVGFPRSMSS
jgi:hypothetical protein